MSLPRLHRLGILTLVALLTGAAPAVGGRDPAPGDVGEVRTALSGTGVETLPLQYLGVLRGALGPGIDLHLVELRGPVAERTGIASGMSGSPVYFDGTLFGALGYRLGAFPRRAVGGVVRIEDVRAADLAASPAAGARSAPIATPLVVVGSVGPDAAWLSSRLADLGLVVAPAAGGSADRSTPRVEPGSPVGVELVRGDLRVAATGTLTSIEGETAYAFGHSFLGVGRVELPLVAAEVVHVLEDMAGSTKIANLGAEIGAILDDRVTSVVGRLDARARTVPVRFDITGATFDDTVRRYEIVDHALLTPMLLGTVTSNALLGGVEREVELTLRVRGRIELEDLPGLPVDLTVAARPGFDPGGVVAGGIQQVVSALYANPFRQPRMLRAAFEIEAAAGARSYRLERLLYDRGPVRPGAEIEVVCMLRGYRGDVRRERLRVLVPADLAPGSRLAVAVGDPDAIETARGRPLAARLSGAPDLESWITILAERPAANVLAAELVRASRALVASGRELEELPGTALRLLSAGAGSRGKRIPAETLDRDETELDGPVQGGLMARFVVDGAPGEGEDE